MLRRIALLSTLFLLCLSFICAQENAQNQQNFSGEQTSAEDTASYGKQASSVDKISAGEEKFSVSQESSENQKSKCSSQTQTFFVVNFPENFEKKVSDCVRIENSFSTEKGILSNYLTISLANSFDYLYGKNYSAVQFTEDSTSFIFENTFWLIRKYKIENENPKLIFKLGTDFYYNYEYLTSISSKHNLFYGLNFEHNFRNLITSRGKIFCGSRFSHIFVFGKDSPYIYNWDLQAKFEFIFHSALKLEPYFSIASFEDFRYPLFCAPIFTFGAIYEIKKNFTFGILGSVRYIDFFTLSSYIDSWVLKIYIEYQIDEVSTFFSKFFD